MDRLDYIARQDARLTVSGAPQGYDAYGNSYQQQRGYYQQQQPGYYYSN